MSIDEYNLKLKTIFVISAIFGALLLILTHYKHIIEIMAASVICGIVLFTTPTDKAFVKNVFNRKNLFIGLGVELLLTYTNFINTLMGYFSFGISADENVMTKLFFPLIMSVSFFVLALPMYMFLTFYFSDNYYAGFKKYVYDFAFSNRFYCICYALVAIGLIIQIKYAFNVDIFGDEGFTLGLIKNSYTDVVKFTAQDVHPPLYYLIVKLVEDVFHLVLPDINPIYIAKLVSIVPYVLLLVVCNTRVKKIWGEHVSALCMLFLFSFPCIITRMLEIRMYGWGLFFVFMAFVEFCDVIREGDKKSWLFFVLYSLGASYTHYFACVSVAILYAIAFVYYLVKKNTEQLKAWLCAAVFTVLAYLPWLFVVILQMMTIKNSFWIEPIDLEQFMYFFEFAFVNNFMIVVSFISFVILIKGLLKGSTETGEAFFALSAVGVIIWTIIFGICISLLYRPIFICRYLVPSLLCLWFGIILSTELVKKNFLKLLMALMILFTGFSGIHSFVKDKNESLMEFNKLTELINDASTDGETIFVTTATNACWMLPSLTNCKVYYYVPDTDKDKTESMNAFYGSITEEVFQNQNLEIIHYEEEILSLTDNKNVYFIQAREGEADELSELNSISCTKLDDYFFGDRYRSIYKLSDLGEN